MTKELLFSFENIGPGYRVNAGCDAYDLSSFFDAIKQLPENQKRDLSIITDEEEMYSSGEYNFMLQNLSNEFIKIAPIIFYRVIENHLKEKLLELYASRLTEKMVDKKGKRKGRKKPINKIIVGANLKTIKYMFEKSSVNLDIYSLNNFGDINEIRELSNCLKHNQDKVNSGLNKANLFWVIETPITFELVNERLKKIPQSIFDFFAHLEEKTR